MWITGFLGFISCSHFSFQYGISQKVILYWKASKLSIFYSFFYRKVYSFREEINTQNIKWNPIISKKWQLAHWIWNKTKRSNSIVKCGSFMNTASGAWGWPLKYKGLTIHLSDIGQNILIYVERRRHIRGLFHAAAGQKISHFFRQPNKDLLLYTKCSFSARCKGSFGPVIRIV